MISTMLRRENGAVHPGIPWGPFTFRIPFVHTRVEVPELVQGLVVAGATGLSIIPLCMADFGMNYEVALALVIVQSILLTTSPILFGEPYCPGWFTPTLPLVLAFATRIEATDGDFTARVHAVNAVVLTVAGFFFFMGITGLGRTFVRSVSPALKGGIILGAAISAVLRVTTSHGGQKPWIEVYPVTILLATIICLFLMFSVPLERYKQKYKWILGLASLGLAPGFAVALFVGPFAGEFNYGGLSELMQRPDMSTAERWFFWPPFGELFRQYSPLAIGFPELRSFIDALPLAVAAYIIGFGDIVTGNEILKEPMKERPDEVVELNETRTHLSVGVRNAAQCLIGGPFFPLQGMLWTGAMVVVAERYRRGREAMDSIFSGIFSYYVFGLPVLFLVRPVVEFFRPALVVSIALTLLLTAFACGYVAMALPRDRVERGITLATGTTIAIAGAAWGLGLGIVLTVLLTGLRAFRPEPEGYDI
jgi:hypothetical protein